MMHKNEKGFTLVELMVVVVIIGILVAIAIPIYNTIQETAEANAKAATERTIAGSYQTFLADKGAGTTSTWPDDYLAGYTGDETSVSNTDEWPDASFVKDGNVWNYTPVGGS